MNRQRKRNESAASDCDNVRHHPSKSRTTSRYEGKNKKKKNEKKSKKSPAGASFSKEKKKSKQKKSNDAKKKAKGNKQHGSRSSKDSRSPRSSKSSTKKSKSDSAVSQPRPDKESLKVRSVSGMFVRRRYFHPLYRRSAPPRIWNRRCRPGSPSKKFHREIWDKISLEIPYLPMPRTLRKCRTSKDTRSKATTEIVKRFRRLKSRSKTYNRKNRRVCNIIGNVVRRYCTPCGKKGQKEHGRKRSSAHAQEKSDRRRKRTPSSRNRGKGERRKRKRTSRSNSAHSKRRHSKSRGEHKDKHKHKRKRRKFSSRSRTKNSNER